MIHSSGTLPTAFVLGLFDTGLAAVRSLGRAGVPVMGLDFDPQHVGFASRYCMPRRCPHPDHDPKALLAFMLEAGRKLGQPGILIPAADTYVLFVSRHREQLRRYYRFNLPSESIIEACVDKRLQNELAQHVGCPSPRTFHVDGWQAAHRLRGPLRYPAFIKPCVSHLWTERFAVKGFEVADERELTARLGEILASGLEVLVQEIIPGPESNICQVYAYFDQQRQPLAHFTLRKMRQSPPQFGVGSMVESIDHPRLLEAGLAFLAGIGYQGIAAVEFKEDARDGSLQLIELNPRIGQQTILATDSGINLPLMLYRDLAGLPQEAPKPFRAGRRWVDAQRDLKSFLAYRRRGELSLGSWLCSWGSVRSFAKFAWDDPQPFWRATRRQLAKLARIPIQVGTPCRAPIPSPGEPA